MAEHTPGADSTADRLVSLLADRDPEVSERAEAALREAMLRGPISTHSAAILAVAVDRYVEHRRVAVAELLVRFRASLFWRAAQENPLAPVLRDPGHPIHMVVRGLIRRGALAEDAALLWRVMVEPVWAAACREHLASRLTRAERAELLSTAYLGLNPHRSRLAEPQTRAAALAAERRDVGSLAKLAASSDERTALAAARVVALTRPRDATEREARETALQELCAHPCRAIVTVAMQVAHEDARATNRRRTRVGRDATIRELRSALGSAEPMGVARAVECARQLRMCRDLAPELCRTATSRDARSAAAACAALRVCSDEQSYAALCLASQAADHRVAATAIESLVTVAIALGRLMDIMPLLERASEDDRHRVRASAARALTQAGHARGESVLLAMLEDSRSRHRLAGLWVVERLLRAGLVEPEIKLARSILRLDEPTEPTAIRGSSRRCAAMISRELLSSE